MAQIESTLLSLSPQQVWVAGGVTRVAGAGGIIGSGGSVLSAESSGQEDPFAAMVEEALNPASADGSGTSAGTGSTSTPDAIAVSVPGATTTTTGSPVSSTSTRGGAGSDFGDSIVETARKHLGVRYTWGGNSPSQGFDCSGLVKHVMAELGVSMPRVARDQAKVGTEIGSLAEARPGDLLGMRNGSHIAIFLGGNKILHAPRPGETVSIRSLFSWDDIDTIRRVVPSGAGAASGVTTESGATRAAFEQVAGALS
ncbi:C40 family peptidase [Citricoccus sp. GCM10030269]|uniref:C40 family peptidase n=1 Tax=Citricoccus sp. GCM10030269 TaxID=3273388 RepID=UPI00366A63DD